MRSPEDLAEGLRARARRFACFAAWESTHRTQPTPAAAVASVGAIYALLPPSSRRRAVERSVRVVTAEDLILMKIISERERDIADAEAIVRRRGHALDREYLEPRLRELANALEQEEVLQRWRRWTSD